MAAISVEKLKANWLLSPQSIREQEPYDQKAC